MHVTPSGKILGATIEGLALSRPLQNNQLKILLDALGQYGVLRFPRQQLTGRQLKDFSAQLGELEINVASGAYQEPGVPEVMILSNIVRDGKPIGLADAGQGWHTDMSYSRTIALANVLYGIEIPQRGGKTLGATQFGNMQAAYDGLPQDLKSKAKPPVSHPIFLTHPFSGRKVLYANPGYSIRINELPQKESDETLEFLFAHQVKPEYLYTFRWQQGDVLLWEDIGTIHNAVADYGPDEHRLIKRCQVMAARHHS